VVCFSRYLRSDPASPQRNSRSSLRAQAKTPALQTPTPMYDISSQSKGIATQVMLAFLLPVFPEVVFVRSMYTVYADCPFYFCNNCFRERREWVTLNHLSPFRCIWLTNNVLLTPRSWRARVAFVYPFHNYRRLSRNSFRLCMLRCLLLNPFICAR